MTPSYHLAQLNIARMLYPLDDSRMAGFVNQLDAINALAESADGFVWRLKGEGNNATDLRFLGDAMLIVNMSVWQSAEALHNYTYRSAHAGVFRDRKQWFELPTKGQFNSCMWWIAAGTVPTLVEAQARLLHLRKHGPTSFSFTFKQRFAVPSE